MFFLALALVFAGSLPLRFLPQLSHALSSYNFPPFLPFHALSMCFLPALAGMQRLVQNSPTLAAAPELRDVMRLRSIDCIATRLWFDRRVSTRFPANVLADFEGDVGATFFNLNDLQDEYAGPEQDSVIAAGALCRNRVFLYYYFEYKWSRGLFPFGR